MRDTVTALLALGRLPTAASSADQVGAFERALAGIHPPLTDDEAEALLAMFHDEGAEDGFGMAWSLVHLIETSPTPMPRHDAGPAAGEWLRLLFDRQ